MPIVCLGKVLGKVMKLSLETYKRDLEKEKERLKMLGIKRVKDLFGFIPMSVWYVKNKGMWPKIIGDDIWAQSKVYGNPLKTDHTYVDKETGKVYIRKIKYSEFHPIVAERIIRLWSNKGDHIVDPFSGRITRAVVSLVLGRSYEGYEIGPNTYRLTLERMNETIKRLKAFGKEVPSYKLWNADGCKMEYTPDLSADLIFTCPPYWKAERYEKVRGQLSEMTYSEFLRMIEKNAENAYRVLKWNKYAIYVVGDVRFDDVYYPLHIDFIEIFKSAGFDLWDIIINVLRSPHTAVAAGRAVKKRYTIKTHEYILVFKKTRKTRL